MSEVFRTILFGTDFSEGAAHALEHALFWARGCKAQLHVLHVIELPPGMDSEFAVNKIYLEQARTQAETRLRALVGEVERQGMKVATQIETGIPSQTITQIGESLNADLLVLGTRGLSGLTHLLIGSTAERVVRTAPCPVLTVRRPTDRKEKKVVDKPVRVQRILAPLDFSDCSLDALEVGIWMARTFNAALTIQHVLEPMFFGLDLTLRHVEEHRQLRKRIEGWLSELESRLAASGLRATHVVSTGTVADTILARSQQQLCDLIVLGTHGRRGLSHIVSGSVAEAVVRQAGCPVLTVKSPKFAPGHERILGEHRERAPSLGHPSQAQ